MHSYLHSETVKFTKILKLYPKGKESLSPLVSCFLLNVIGGGVGEERGWKFASWAILYGFCRQDVACGLPGKNLGSTRMMLNTSCFLYISRWKKISKILVQNMQLIFISCHFPRNLKELTTQNLQEGR